MLTADESFLQDVDELSKRLRNCYRVVPAFDPGDKRCAERPDLTGNKAVRQEETGPIPALAISGGFGIAAERADNKSCSEYQRAYIEHILSKWRPKERD